MAEIKPIETYYAGCRFRSRLEARWAVFFDALGIKWEYEPEGFETKSGERYLPDFYLPNDKIYAEVKPPTAKWVDDFHRADKFVGKNGIGQVVFLSNIPDDRSGREWFPVFPVLHYDTFTGINSVRYASFMDGIFNRRCGASKVYASEYFEAMAHCRHKEGDLDGLLTDYLRVSLSEETEKEIRKQYNKARSARFEHGEEG